MEEESSSAIVFQPELDVPRYGILGFGGTHVGTRHDHNEDRLVVQRTAHAGALLIVCDGMGGMGRGDQASAFALTRLVEMIGRGHLPALEAAATAIRQVDRELRTTLGDDGSGRQPGTTCAVVQVTAGMAHVSWVGDSGVMLIRDGRVAASCRPHRIVQDLIDQRAMTEEEARTSPMARFLARSLGGRDADDAPVEPESCRWRLLPGDAIVVCSDGLSDMLRPREIAQIVSRGGSPEQTVHALIAEALVRRADDNVSVVVARCVHAALAGEDELLCPAWDGVPDQDGDDQDSADGDADLRGPATSEVPRPAAAWAPVVLVAGGVLALAGVALGLAATWLLLS